jgi:Family of unknown function (DUF5947)
MTDAEWTALRLPIDLAFFVHITSAERVIAFYPSPAGCTESLLDLTAWQDIVQRNPEIARIRPDVGALLVNRTRGERQYFIAPIDECYRLTGIIRQYWRGLSGGDELWQQVARFFEALRQRAGEQSEVPGA